MLSTLLLQIVIIFCFPNILTQYGHLYFFFFFTDEKNERDVTIFARFYHILITEQSRIIIFWQKLWSQVWSQYTLLKQRKFSCCNRYMKSHLRVYVSIRKLCHFRSLQHSAQSNLRNTLYIYGLFWKENLSSMHL